MLAFASPTSRPRRTAIASIATVGVALLLTACGTDAEDSPAPDLPTETAVEEAPTSATSEAEETAPAAEAALPDICDLVSAEEITSIIGAYVVATEFTYGSIADGGQCIWTTDPNGDVFASGAGQLELVAWVPGGIFPPPDDAPAAGTAGTAMTDAGAYFTSDDRVFWLRLTGAAYLDAAAVSSTQALAATVDGRV